LPAPRDPAVQAVGERLPVAGVERGGAAGLHAGAAQLFHEIADAQAFGDVVAGEAFAARVDRLGAVGQHPGGQRDVLGDHQVARARALGDRVVGDVEPALHLQRADIARGRGPQPLVGDQRHRHAGALGGAEQDVAHRHGARIGVDPDLGRAWRFPGHGCGGGSPSPDLAWRAARFLASFSSCFFFLASSRWRFS